MKQLKTRLGMWTLHAIIIIVAISGIITALPIYATPSYNISNSIINLSLSAGQTRVSKITVTNISQDEYINFKIEIAGLGQGVDGSNLALSAAQDTGSHSARSFCNTNKTTLQIAPDKSESIDLTIAVPFATQKGEYYAAVYFYTSDEEQDKVGIKLASIIPVILNVNNFTPSSTSAQISGLSVPQAVTGKSIIVETLFKNTGNSRISGVTDTVTLLNLSGTQLAQGVINLTAPSILPDYTRLFRATFSSRPSGSYSVRSVVTNSNGTVINSKTISFSVTQLTTDSITGTLPEIESFSPTSGGLATLVVISGANFSNVTSVGFGGIEASSFVINSDNQITASVGNGASGLVTVTNENGTASSSSEFIFTGITATTSATPTSTTPVSPTSTRNGNKGRPSNGFNESDRRSEKSLPGMDLNSIVVMRFVNQSEPHLNAVEQDDVEVTLIDSGDSGYIIVGKYQTLPETIEPDAPVTRGGVNKNGIKYFDVRVEEFNRGTAIVSVYYSSAEIINYDEDSLIIAYYYNDRWNICRNLKIDKENQTVSGEIPVIRLNGTLICLGGDKKAEANALPINTGSSSSEISRGFSWSLFGIIISSVVFFSGIVYAVIGINRRRNQSSQPAK